jgi:hypothetical protein
MTQKISVPLAVEKVLFRIALREGGRVTLARAFAELPISIEDLERHADAAVDGRVLLKDDWGEFLSYDLPELKSTQGALPVPGEGCATCGAEVPPLEVEPPPAQESAAPASETAPAAPIAPPPAGAQRPVVCDGCYGAIRRAARVRDASALAWLKSLWKTEEDPEKVGQVEHEIVHVALKQGGTAITHTAIAAQTMLSAAAVKECLDRFALRRYVRVGVAPAGDTLVYTFPPGLTYPTALYKRFKRDDGLPGGGRVEPRKPLEVKSKPVATPELKIVVKEKRQRPGRGFLRRGG